MSTLSIEQDAALRALGAKRLVEVLQSEINRRRQDLSQTSESPKSNIGTKKSFNPFRELKSFTLAGTGLVVSIIGGGLTTDAFGATKDPSSGRSSLGSHFPPLLEALIGVGLITNGVFSIGELLKRARPLAAQTEQEQETQQVKENTAILLIADAQHAANVLEGWGISKEMAITNPSIKTDYLNELLGLATRYRTDCYDYFKEVIGRDFPNDPELVTIANLIALDAIPFLRANLTIEIATPNDTVEIEL